jgi:hypothetical protein
MAASTLTGVALLASMQAVGLQVPAFLVGWLAPLLGLDGERAYDAAYVVFLAEINLLGIAIYLMWLRAFGS